MVTEAELKQKLGPEYVQPKIVVWFEDHARRNAQLTQKSGRPRFTSEIFYCERNPKDSSTLVKRVASKEDFERWPEQFEHYQKVHAIRSEARVRFLPGMDVGTAKEMNAMDVYTLEQLVATDVPEWSEWRLLARKVLAAINSEDSPVDEPVAPVYTGSADFSMEFRV